MNRSYLTLLIFIIITFQEALAQSTRTEKAISGFQIGLGGWVHREFGIRPGVALRAEAGLDIGFWGGSFYGGTFFAAIPVIRVEPRIYYNISKRSLKNRNTQDNAANFFSFRISHHPNWFVITNSSIGGVIRDFMFVPHWGIRRNLGNHFNFETGFGVGWVYFPDYPNAESPIVANLVLRFGFKFARKPYAP